MKLSVKPMNWKPSCRSTRRMLSLWAGNDLEPQSCATAERHLAVCPACREVWEHLQNSQRALERARERGSAVMVADRRSSVWPGVSRHLRSIDDTQVVAPNWRDWLPAGAVAAACLALISLVLPDVQSGGDMADYRSAPIVISHPAMGQPSDPRDVREVPLSLPSEAGPGVPLQPFRYPGVEGPRNF
jgi:hypothetical protein